MDLAQVVVEEIDVAVTCKRRRAVAENALLAEHVARRGQNSDSVMRPVPWGSRTRFVTRGDQKHRFVTARSVPQTLHLAARAPTLRFPILCTFGFA